jgi:hypothetical protein
MIVWVTGMHRSGTSMVMSLLHGLGLHLGNQRNIKWTLAAAGRGESRRLIDAMRQGSEYVVNPGPPNVRPGLFGDLIEFTRCGIPRPVTLHHGGSHDEDEVCFARRPLL